MLAMAMKTKVTQEPTHDCPHDKEYWQLLRYDFMTFAHRAFYELNPQAAFAPASFLEQIAAKLEDCRKGKIKRLIVNLPPRSLKSHLASVVFPAWCLGHDPAMQIICASYGQDLADKFARDCRTVMMSPWYRQLFPNTCLIGRQSVADFTTTQSGNRMSTSVGGVLTGRGADMIIIDDPMKPDEALSETRRKAVNGWYDNTLVSRLNNKQAGCIIAIMQRLHQDDLVAHVMEQDDWELLSFPAIAMVDEDVPIVTPFDVRRFKRQAGEALHPEREPLNTLEQIRQTIGEYNFQSQYQQDPAPAGGAMIKTDWLKYYEPGDEPKFSMIVQSWDTANKPGELNDYSVCTTWGMRDGRYYLLDVYRQKLNYPELKRAVHQQAALHKPQAIIIEDKASGTQLIQELRSEAVFGIKAYEPLVGTDKIMRLHAQAIGFENGLVFLPRHAFWLTDYVNELTTFPGAKYDDQVDSTTQALGYMRDKNTSLAVWEKLGRAAS